MPNATVRADARTMPIDRRATLGAFVAGAVALLAAPAAAVDAHPDEELLALQPEIDLHMAGEA